MRWIALGMLVAVPAAAEPLYVGWAPPTAGEWVFVGVAAGLSIMDVLQTSDCLYHQPREVPPGTTPGTIVPPLCHEQNPLLGEHPGRLRLWGSMAGGLLLMSAAFYALPPGWRTALPAAVAGVELGMVFHNADRGLSLAFHF